MAVRKLSNDGVSMYPLDIEALEKGDFIPPEIVEEFSGKKRNDPMYSLQCEKLKSMVRRRLHRIGRAWTLRCEKGGVAVLSDPSAAVYADKRDKANYRQQGRILCDALGVDVSRLPDKAEKDTHEQRVNRMSRERAARCRERRRVPLAPHKRNVPGLPTPKPDTR